MIDLSPHVTLAVLSDLHCHAPDEFEGREESLLIANALRMPPTRHPIQSLISLVRDEGLHADAVLCPGDLAHKASQQGLQQSWSHLAEVAIEMRAPTLISTLGNHDVESRRGGDPFRTVRNLHPDFPLRDQNQRMQFWSNGFCLQPLTADVDVVVINTASHHFSEAEAQHGTFDEAQVQELDDHLRRHPVGTLRFAVLHHHPVLHSFAGFDSRDVLPTGDRLLEVLVDHGCTFVIHGHRHHAQLRRCIVDGRTVFVLAAGSLSAFLNQLWTRTRNLFHLVEFGAPAGTGIRGRVRTWEFGYSMGWRPSSVLSSEFPAEAYFGPHPGGNVAKSVISTLLASGRAFLPAAQLPELSNLTPDELTVLARDISAEGKYTLDFDDNGCIEGIGRIASSEQGAP